MFYSALMLTGVNLLLRFVGTSFQVYLSGVLGAAGVGLLQLVLSVGSLAMVAGIGGIRTATMYLTAEELGKRRKENVSSVLSGCMVYSILCSGAISVLLFTTAPFLARYWIGDIRTLGALRLFAAFLPVSCLCGVMTGYFTAAGRIGMLAAVETAEQLVSMAVTMGSLKLWAGVNPGRACMCVILGSCAGAALTLGALVILRIRERAKSHRIPVRSRILHAAVPLAAADVLKSGITTTENLMVPKRLGQNPAIADPLAAFGTLSGMVFPVLMFPACILFALAELLIPELARCAAAGQRQRIRYLARRSLKVAMLYGLAFGGLQYLLADVLCIRLYDSREAGYYLKLYAFLTPMLYCDAITDAMTKGLGQQKTSVRYNILTSAMDVILLFLLLPKYGMEGYFFSFLVTHLLNFCLSLGLLRSTTEEGISPATVMLAGAGCLLAAFAAGRVHGWTLQIPAFLGLLGSLWCLFGVIGKEDVLWLQGLIRKEK